MTPVSTSMTIAAPPERVWEVLTDFAAYPEWNPFMTSVTGSLGVGKRLSVRIHPPGGKPMGFKPTILVVKPFQELRWLGRLIVPGLFDGEHYFRLAPTVDGTMLDHGENFSGLIVKLAASSMLKQTEQGFIAMNRALKHRAEH